MINEKQLSVVIVNYRSESYLEKCLASVFSKAGGLDLEVIIINNDPQEELERFCQKYPSKLSVINAEKNDGFGAANNKAVSLAAGKILLFLNPDTEIMTENISSILKFFNDDEGVAIIGSRLVADNGQSQEWSAGKETTLWQIIKNNLGLPASRTLWEKKEKTPAEAVSGAAMFVRKKAFQKIGGFDEKFFLYYEDEDLCKRARTAGYKIFYQPAFAVRHYGGKSMLSSAEQKKEFYKSQEYYFQKHLGAIQTALLKFLRKMHG